jgi:predicted amidophosphoribosyltransferase
MLGALFAVLMPGRCAVCERPGDALCASCRSSLVRLHEPLCERCGSPGPWPVRRCAECAGRRIAFARARAAVVYEERARRFVREWKEHGRRRLADEAAAVVAEVVPRPGGTVALTYVPGDRERAWRRGDVGPRALAHALAEIWELPVHDLLRRVGSQPRQRGLALAERRRNVRGSVVATRTSPRSVCLVDDIYTTGATADACASALRKAGAARVEVVTLARAVR